MAEESPLSDMTQDEIDEYREAFSMFDINGDGASESRFASVQVGSLQDRDVLRSRLSFCGWQVELRI